MRLMQLSVAGALVLCYFGAVAVYAAIGLGVLSVGSAAWWLLPAAVVLFTRARSALLPVAVLGLTDAGTLSWWQAILALLPAFSVFTLMDWLGGAIEAFRKLHRAWKGLM